MHILTAAVISYDTILEKIVRDEQLYVYRPAPPPPLLNIYEPFFPNR